MKKCLDCECIYPDYHEKCPACGSKNKKEWEHIGNSNNEKQNDNLESRAEEDIYKDIIDASEFTN